MESCVPHRFAGSDRGQRGRCFHRVWSKISNALKRLDFRPGNFLAQLLSETSVACTIQVRRSSLGRLWSDLAFALERRDTEIIFSQFGPVCRFAINGCFPVSLFGRSLDPPAIEDECEPIGATSFINSHINPPFSLVSYSGATNPVCPLSETANRPPVR